MYIVTIRLIVSLVIRYGNHLAVKAYIHFRGTTRKILPIYPSLKLFVFRCRMQRRIISKVHLLARDSFSTSSYYVSWESTRFMMHSSDSYSTTTLTSQYTLIHCNVHVNRMKAKAVLASQFSALTFTVMRVKVRLHENENENESCCTYSVISVTQRAVESCSTLFKSKTLIRGTSAASVQK